MATEIDLGGTIYISSRHAASITGYTQDYIGQLARSGSIEAQRVSGVWYVREESLRAYKEKADQFVPTPPPYIGQPTPEVSVSFDGKDYVSAKRASEMTSYHQDYIGQLARSGQILGRQIGNRWYVERDSLLKHKAEKDALLAAVQVESVGLLRHQEAMPRKSPQTTSELHYRYVSEENAPLIAEIPPQEDLKEESAAVPSLEDEIPADVEQYLTPEKPISEARPIPIHVIRNESEDEIEEEAEQSAPIEPRRAKKRHTVPVFMTYVLGTLAAFIVLSGGYLVYSGTPRNGSLVAESQSAIAPTGMEGAVQLLSQAVATIIPAAELVYKRE